MVNDYVFPDINMYDKYLQATVYQPTLANKINSLENEIISIKKRERMHNEDMENIMRILGQMQKKNATKAGSDQDIVTFQNEISIKFNELNNKFKKFTREVKQYI
jgi:predicted  nucleic acid-binding Zn-ribbon protein